LTHKTDTSKYGRDLGRTDSRAANDARY
jgi:hypothetical protein